jgi:hypothetical protein
MNGNKRLIILGALLLVASVPLHIVYGLFLVDYEDSTAGAWDWPSLSQWMSSLSPGLKAGWWASVIGSQVSLYGGLALIGFALYRWFMSRRAAA